MKAQYDKDLDTVTVTLSERNLLALLAQLRDPTRPAPALGRQGGGQGEPSILVQGQADEDHYQDREPAGVMRIGTSALMVEVKDEHAST